MDFKLTILGHSGAVPAFGRFPTAQFLQVGKEHMLIDCGEGAQIRLRQYNCPFGKINRIFISHLHGDHFFGLIGLLTSYALSNRDQPLDIYSPPGLQGMIEAQVAPAGGRFGFPITFHELRPETPQCIVDTPYLRVTTLPLVHRVPTCGFLFEEKERLPNIIPEKIKIYQLSIEQIKAAKTGRNVRLADGTSVTADELVVPPAPPRRYAYCSDTAYQEELIPRVKGVDLLYHESTFCEDAADRAAETLHATARQAAEIASKAGVDRLLLGHFSSRYPDLSVFEFEAREVFPTAEASREGHTYTIPQTSREERLAREVGE